MPTLFVATGDGITERLLSGDWSASMKGLNQAVLLFVVIAGSLAEADDDVGPVASRARVRPVLAEADCHSIHSYYVSSPESPDGQRVLLYRSAARDGHRGEIVVFERSSGALRVLAENVEVEDAHRAACQQWIRGGRAVVFHDLRDGEWVVASVDVESGEERVLARGRQLGWTTPAANVVPLYGPHWNPGAHRDLELLDLDTGEIRTALTAEEVKAAHADWIARQFGERPVSIFFPVLSPDGKCVLFKLATPAGGGFRHSAGSERQGLFVYELSRRRPVYFHATWGHPAWHPDSRHLLNIWNSRLVLIDTDTGEVTKVDNLPAFPGGHPSFSPDGRSFVTDVRIDAVAGGRPLWGVVSGDFSAGQHRWIHRFENDRGAQSWRKSHPHPVFSPDGRGIYFNVSADGWTRLYVADTELRAAATD
ncbi:MAG: hypothetical protein KY476_16025 [Planctomycetes bacterium]|nr:hypothetical protein [Planctomycetota bacterium]